MDIRLQHEIAHGKFLVQHDAGEIWNWETPAGKVRWKRRVEILISHIISNMQVLEIGCGTGYLTKELVKTQAAIAAIDISLDLIEDSRKNIKYANVHFLIGNGYQLSFRNQIFDFVVGSSVLHHLEVDKALCELYRVLKPGGTLLFTEPNMLNPQIALQKNIPYIKKKLGDSPDETAFFRWSLTKTLREIGFQDVSVEPFDFLHPFVPRPLIGVFDAVGCVLEKIPFIKEIAGSLLIYACKPEVS